MKSLNLYNSINKFSTRQMASQYQNALLSSATTWLDRQKSKEADGTVVLSLKKSHDLEMLVVQETK